MNQLRQLNFLNRLNRLHGLIIPFSVALFACDPAAGDGDAEEPRDAVALANPNADADADADDGDDAETRHRKHLEHLEMMGRHHGEMPDARANFDEVVSLVREHYVDGALSEDALWTGAIEGVLGRLYQVPGHPINTLMSPKELAELEVGTKGQIVGVGVMIEFVAGVLVVRDVIPGAPAATAGLKAGDRILGVDGVRLKDSDLHRVVDMIRGEEGSTVELFMQRDTEEWTVEITRGTVKVASVEGRMLQGGVGYLRINSFTKTTAEEVDASLSALEGEGLKSLVLDLRYCPGGMLESSVAVADHFLPAGKRVVTLRGKDGEEKHMDTESAGRWESLPLSVLVGAKTASGAEILAAALSHHDRGTLVGEPPLGKRTVESVHDLPNKWAVKLTISRFFPPGDDVPADGPSVRPHITIPSAEDVKKRPRLVDLDVNGDAPLRAAADLLAAQGR